jgi:hypothetical protein
MSVIFASLSSFGFRASDFGFRFYSTMAITKKALERVRDIHRMSRRYNGRRAGSHTGALMALVREHVDEIEELLRRGDPHAAIETGDLAILCFELILERRRRLPETIETCLGRYEQKLEKLLAGQRAKSRRTSKMRQGARG